MVPPVSEQRDLAPWPRVGYWIQVGAAVIGIVVVLRMVMLLQTVLLLVLASMVLAAGLQPPIEVLTARGWRRGTALAVVLGATGLLVVAVLGSLVPSVLSQSDELAAAWPELIEEISETGTFGEYAAERLGDLDMASDDETVTRTLGTAAQVGFNVFTVLVLTPYFAMAFPQMKLWLLRVLRREDRKSAVDLLNGTTTALSGYVLGNLTISAIAGVIAYGGFRVIGLRFALVLAIWVALTDLIPIAGAFIGAVPALAIAAIDSLGTVVAVAVLLFVYQMVENYLISPRVMKRSIDLSPAAVIIALMVGSTLAGVLGALLALPVAATLKILVETLVIRPRVDRLRTGTSETRGDGGGRRLP